MKTIDCHQHPGTPEQVERTIAITDMLGFDQVCVVCTGGRETVTANPLGLLTKSLDPSRVYLFAGLDHSEFFNGRPEAADLPGQMERLLRIGADGVKLIEGKPTSRRTLKVKMDAPYYEGFFQAAEDLGTPLLWHVADPEEFWDEERIPSWAKERDWGYSPQDVQKETLYKETEHVLVRHPGLRVILAHFYFLSADLKRAEEFLEEHPNCGFDLAPGIEMLYNLSADPETSRNFFTRFAGRIYYGTDMFPRLNDAEAQNRAGIVRRFLETADEFRISEDADFLLGSPADGLIRGINLDKDALEQIYRENFHQLAGSSPAALDLDAAAGECDRIAAIARKPDEALTAAELLRGVS